MQSRRKNEKLVLRFLHETKQQEKKWTQNDIFINTNIYMAVTRFRDISLKAQPKPQRHSIAQSSFFFFSFISPHFFLEPTFVNVLFPFRFRFDSRGNGSDVMDGRMLFTYFEISGVWCVMRIVPCEWHMFFFHARSNSTRSKLNWTQL